MHQRNPDVSLEIVVDPELIVDITGEHTLHEQEGYVFFFWINIVH